MLGGSCLTLDFWFRVCIMIILAIALWRLMMLFLPFLESRLPTLVVQIINIVIWAAVAILCLIILFFFISCIWGLVSGTFGGAHFRSGLGLVLPAYYAERLRELSPPWSQSGVWQRSTSWFRSSTA